jgi:hypothetical protein
MVLISGKDMTMICFLATSGAGIVVVLMMLIYSAFLGWTPILVDFNFYREGVAELLIMSWAFVYFFIYTNHFIKQAVKEGTK